MWCIIILFLLSPSHAEKLVVEEKEFLIERFRAMLHDEAAKLVRQHTTEIAKPPEFDTSSDFMRSFVDNTGVGNREDLIIKNINEAQIFYDATFTQWHYKRFNNTNYILGASNRLVVLNKMDSEQNFFIFSKDEAVFNFVPDHKSIVIDTTIYTRSVKRSVSLYVSILTESAKLNQVHVFEILGNKGLMVALITLRSTSTGPFVAKKISYVQSQNGGSLVVLTSTQDVSKITYEQEGSMEENHYIEVLYPSAVDMITYTIHGHGYMAVSNSTTCEIFKMNHVSKSHLLFDSIRSQYGGFTDLENFRLGFHNYLVVAGKDKQDLYVWKNGEYSRKQIFDVPNVRQIYSVNVPSCRDDVLLFFIMDDSVRIYIYNGGREVFVKSSIELPPSFIINPGSITSFTNNSKAVLLFLSKSEDLHTFLIETSLNSVPNPIPKKVEKISKYMTNLQQMLREQNEQILYIREVIQNAVRKSGNQTITSFQTFDELHSTEGAVVESINSTIFVEWDGSDLTLDQYKKGTEWLEQHVFELEKLVDDIEKIIPDVVRIDEEVDIIGTKHFIGDITGSSISAFSVNLQSVAGVNIPQLQKEVYRLDKPQKINGTLTFKEPLTITGNLDVETTVNGIDFSKDVMTTNTVQTSHAQMTFGSKIVVQGDLDVSGTLNGIKVEDEFITLSGSHVIKGKKDFQNGVIAENVTAQVIDGVDINDLLQNAITKTGRQEITGTMTFSGGLETADIQLYGKLNGYDISELAEDIVRIDKPATITGHKTFLEDVTIDGALTVNGKVNNLRIPEDLFLTDFSQEVSGHKEFTGVIFAENVQVTDKINGLSIPEDIVTLSGDDEISGTLYFSDGINVMGDIIVEGLVDGIDISEVTKQALKSNDSNEFEHAIFFGPVTVTGNIDVRGLVNDVNLHNLVQDIVYKDDLNVIVDSEKHFKKVVAEKVILEKMINGFNLSVDFMKVHGDQVIEGIKTFKKPVTFNTINIEDGLIGELNITRLYENRLSLIIEDEIEKDVEFTNDVVVEGNLIVHGTIDGLRIPEDVVLKNSTQTISNKVFTNYVKVDNLLVNGDVKVSQSFGGINLTQFYNDRITLHGDHVIEGDLFIGESSASVIEVEGKVNGVDIVEFAGNVMSKTKKQTISAPKEFTGTTTALGDITTKEGVNGVDLRDLNNRAFKLYGDNVVTGHFDFQDIIVNNITLGGLINGVNLNYLAENSLKKTGLQYIKGVTIFEDGFHVEGNINADSVNDLVIPEDVLLKSTSQTINGQFTVGSLSVSGDLNVKGLVNGLNLSEIAPQLARISKDVVLESNVTFIGPIKVIQDIKVLGLVNGVDLNKLSDNVVLKNGYQEIRGHKVLKGHVTIQGDVDIGLINGVDWQQFASDVVRIDRPQTIKGPKNFIGDTEADTVHSLLTQVDLVNGRSLKNMIEDAVFADIPTNITGTKVFKSPVEITGNLTAELINGLQLKTDVVTLMCSEDGPQVITGQKTFKTLTADADIHVAGTVNSYNLFDLYQDTLLTEGDQIIRGHKSLTKEVTFMKNVYPDTVNGMKLQGNLVTLDTDQIITGPIIFNGDVFVEKDLIVKGLIHGVNLTQLAENAVYLDKNQTIGGSYYFNKVVATSDVAVRGTVNGLDLITFDRNVTEFWDDASQSLIAIDTHSEENCEMLEYLQNVLSKSYYVLSAFVLHQNLVNPASYIHVKSPKELSLVALDEFDLGATAVSNVWNSSTKSFVSAGASPTTIARTIIQTISFTEVIINIGIYEEDSYVLIDNSVSNLPSGFREASILIRKQKEAVISLLFPKKGKCELYKLTSQAGSIEIETHGVVSVGKESTSVAMFEIRDTLYLAVSRKYSPPYIRGFCKIFGMVNEGWQRIQSISVAASTFVKHFMYHGYHYLAFTNLAPVHETREPKSIQIYRNSGENELFFSLFQKVPFEDASGIEIFEFGDLSELYLTTWNETIVKIYRLEGESGLRDMFTLHGSCIKDVKALLIENDVYLAVGQQNLRTDEPVNSMLYKSITQGSKYTPHNFTYC